MDELTDHDLLGFNAAQVDTNQTKSGIQKVVDSYKIDNFKKDTDHCIFISYPLL